MFERPRMFDERQLTIEETWTALEVKDAYGTPLGHVKFGHTGLFHGPAYMPRFWFEDAVGARIGEVDGITPHGIRRFGMIVEYEVKDSNGQFAAKIRYRKRPDSRFRYEWLMEDARGRWLLKVQRPRDPALHGFQIVAPDGSLVAQVRKRWVSLKEPLNVEILRQNVDPLLTLSYIVLIHLFVRARHQSIIDFSNY